MSRFQSACLRVHLKSLALRNKKQADNIKAVLDDPVKFDALADMVFAHYQDSAMPGTPLTDFLDWLIENGPAIIAMIVQIIALFG